MVDREDYANARTLATIEHLGESFRIVRRRFNGKPWRKYLALVHGNVNVGSTLHISDVPEMEQECRRLLVKTFSERDSLLAGLRTVKQPAAGHCD